MSRTRNFDVVSSRDLATLLSTIGYRRNDIERALEDGAVQREKVAGWWIYASTLEEIRDAHHLFQEQADQLVADWFVSNPLIAAKAAAKAVGGLRIAPVAADAFMRGELALNRYGNLPVFNKDYVPYLAVHSHDSMDQVSGQLAVIRDCLARYGAVSQRDLKDPDPTPDIRAWRQLLLGHAEYLSMGFLEDDVLLTWDRL